MKASWSSHSPDLLDPHPLVLYPGRGCAHGFACALAAWTFFGDRAEFMAWEEGLVVPRSEKRTIYVLECDVDPNFLLELEKSSNIVVFLSGKKFLINRLDGLCLEKGLIHVDSHRSGARLAWEFFQGDQSAPALFRFAEDRQLSRWKYPETGAFMAHLDTEALSFDRWARIVLLQGKELQDYVRHGEAMLEKANSIALAIAKGASPIAFHGEHGLVVNAPPMFHDAVGLLLAQQCGTYGLVWSLQDNHVQVTLKTAPNHNCSKMAQSIAGAGDEVLSSFSLPLEALPDLLRGSTQPTGSDVCFVASTCADQHGAESFQHNRSVFHGLWNVASLSSRYDKAAWKNVHQQLLGLRLL